MKRPRNPCKLAFCIAATVALLLIELAAAAPRQPLTDEQIATLLKAIEAWSYDDVGRQRRMLVKLTQEACARAWRVEMGGNAA